jgi:signal transduction histidine kinase
MKLRTRLGLGIVSITIVLLVPLILALSSLDAVHTQTRLLRDREFYASLQMGNLRSIVDDVKRSEDAVLITKDPATFARIRRQITALASTSAILGKYIPRETSTDLSTAVFALRAATEAEMRALESDATNTADEISAQRSRPAILTIERVLQRTEARLRDETHDRVEQAASTTIDAQRTAAGSLAIALLLATLIAIWLTRSISRPVYELDKGMKAVADGDFTQRLPAMEKRTDEFGRLANSYHGMTAQLAELDKLKAEFVSVASHELKTPINVIVGYLELLQENIYGELNPKQREICATLGKQAQTPIRSGWWKARAETGRPRPVPPFIRDVVSGPRASERDQLSRRSRIERALARSVGRGQNQRSPRQSSLERIQVH